ncbi:Sec23-binding domain of Sec16-domain-containing protein [Lophiotrema nucula]|uniref:Protein transport protein sec16 n=1 Tax=Lophiotrema nucula TaxID=690887 RepID=A0A6A5ZKM4_9PLEO|nr:Sec23-binding domain of Sec16-domain-containing protein [Lophiotrema nucula]
MDNDDGPNFSYAYGGTSAASGPSWNPALRPDHEETPSNATVTKSIEPPSRAVPESTTEPQAVQAIEQDEDEDEDGDELPTAPAIPSHVGSSVLEDNQILNSDDDFFDRYGAPDVPQSAPQWETEQTNGHNFDETEEAAGLTASEDGLGSREVPVENGGAMNGTHSPAEQEWPGDDPFDLEAPQAHPEEEYEHQGETTLLEEAVAESAEAPLLADAEPATDDWGTTGEVFDLGGAIQDAPLPTPHAEAIGTNVGDEVIGETKVGGSAGDDIDWGTGDDQDFFGGGVAQPPTESKEPAATDSAWDIALDDDFLPDTDDSSAPQFELDDDEGFLEDEPSEPLQEFAPLTQPTSSASRYAPQVSQTPQAAPSPYGVQAPQFTDFSQIDRTKPVAASNVAYGAYAQPSPYQQQVARPPLSSSAQSFADKAKGGYASPYDLPEDIAPVKKRSAPRPSPGPMQQVAPAPPRSSSMAGVSRPPPPSNMSTSSLSPPSSSHSMQSPMTGLPPNALSKPALSKAPSSDFFAELPVTSKPRPSGRYTPQQSVPQTPQGPPNNFAPPQLPPKDRTGSWSSLRNEVLPDSANLIPQLQQPDRLPVFPDQPTAPVRTNSLPVPQTAPPPAPSRYSPAPAAAPTANARYSPGPSTAPATNTRYSPAPPGQGPPGPAHNRYVSEPPTGPPRPPIQPYAPRTSSPLAFHTHTQEQQGQSALTDHAVHQAPGHHPMHSADGVPRAPLRRPLEGVSELEEQEQTTIPPSTTRSETPPPPRSGPSSTVGSPRKRSNYVPQYQPGAPSGVPPLTRSQSQSPGTAMKKPLYNLSNLERPASAGFGAQGAAPNVANIIPHKRQASIEYQFIPPADERVHDPLERWKGYPIFHWGLGGTVVTSFPKQIPRYGGGASMPMMKCSPGEVKVRTVKDAFPLSEDVAKFPGPLKAKGKKKDVSTWLGRRIEGFEAYLQTPGLDQSTSADVIKRLEENLLLWKIMQVLVDNDGRLENNAAAEAAVRKVLSPEGSDVTAGQDGAFSTAADLVGITRSNTSTVQADPVDPKAVEELRMLLTKGDREKAVWHAVDQRLWAHAMLLSSTLNKDVWKQVVQEFVRKEIKKMGPNNQALAVLYEQFAGNSEDCIDELVPASARAGFQMVSTDGAGSTQNALQGLEKWRETLSLILSNRSDNDVTALLSLGRLLAGYGRIEAAHVCFIFARSVALVAGVDDAQADIVLIGADHRSNPSEVGGNLDHILLTEVYEFALSLSSPSGTHVLPHLQSYKLAHAYTLAEYGQRNDAQSYCDAIAYAMKSTTKVSPYYNGSFIASLDDLSKRLSQSPKDGSSSWISKPSMEKVSTSLLHKFTSFVAGDDEDAASNHSGANEVGPFAKVAGNSPGLTPSQSNTDLYGAYSGYGSSAPIPPAPANSRYAPSNAYAPRASIDQGQPRYESQGRPSLESNASSFGGRQPSDSYMPSPQFSGPYTPSQPQFSPPSHRMQVPKTNSYSPLKAEAPTAAISYGSPYQPTPPAEESTPSFGVYDPHQPSFETQPPSPPSEEHQTSNAYDPPSLGYEPSTSGYEPPSYQPYQPDEDDKPAEEQPRKKSFMDEDEDDDLTAKAAALKKQQKAEADRKADEAFRKAAEADAQKDAAAKKGGWLSGWFKKDPNAAPGPIKAKLGEENSFYYDPELKKWVNKKGGAAEASKPMATPPPPRNGPPSRAVSGNTVTANHALGMSSSLGTSLPPSGPPTRPPTSQPPRSSSMPPPMGSGSGPQSRASTPGVPSDSEGKAPPLMPPSFPASSGPPSRPGTGMSNASSIDDLIGAAGSRQGGTVKKGKKRGGRYVDVMAQK